MPFDTRDQFISDMTQGGIAAMEMIARDLKALGIYTSRVLSYEGVEVDPLIVDLKPEQVEVYNLFADAFQIIHQNLQEVLIDIGVVSFAATDGRAKGAALSVFESTKQRFFNAILTGMTGPRLIKEIESDLEAGRAPVLQLVSTAEATLEKRLADIPPSEWHDIRVNITPIDTVMSYLETSFPVELHEEYEVDGDVYVRKALDEDGNPIFSKAAMAVRGDLIERLASLPAIPSILDQILHHFGDDQVAEVTGRSRRVLLKDGRYFVSKRSPSSNISETQAFLDDKKKLLIFSDAGGTGRSYHAGLEFINHRQRVHYLVEPGWKADRAVQGLGRTKRTNQASDPIFRPVSTDVKGQRRFISTIARRLDALGAITRGQREGGTGELFRESDNLESDYARQALYSFYRLLYQGNLDCMRMDEFERCTGLRLTCQEGGLRDDLPPIQRFLNRILALRIDMQNKLFDEFDALHNGAIERAKENGTYELGVEQLTAYSLVAVDRKVIRTQEGTGSESVLVEIERRDKLKLNDFEELMSSGPSGGTGRMMINTRSKRAAVLKPAPGYTDEDGIIIKRYYLYRPDTRETILAEGFEETCWIEDDLILFKEYWETEVNALPEYKTMRFYMVTGLLLPLWKHMPKDNPRVRRLVLDGGERLLGRIVNSAEVQMLYRNLGVDQEVDIQAWDVWEHVLGEGGHGELSGKLKLRRSLVAGDYRLEVTDWDQADKERLKTLGCVSEIIQSWLRIFIPRADVLDKITARNRVVSLS